MIKTLIFLSIFIGNALSCEIHLPENLLIIDQTAKISQSSAHQGCQASDILKIDETLLGIEGSVTHFQLRELLRQKGVEAEIKPSLLKIKNVREFIKEQLHLSDGTQLLGVESISNAEGFITFTEDDKILIECQDCSFSSQQKISILVQNPDGRTKKIDILASFKKFVKAYRVKSFIPAFAPIAMTDLTEDYIESIPFTDLALDLSSLKFFRTNKPLRSGDLLRSADLKAENLVRAGSRTEVIIENELIKLKTTGLSRSNGVWGQVVEVFHPERNKKYQGKVIDINKVLVEL